MADSLKICVVDDDRDVAEGLAEILQMVGHQVHTVFSGQDALGVLGQEDFDIGFINAELPDLTDLESFMEVRKIKPDMQTVMMTGYTIEQLLRQAVGNGSVHVLQKPVTMDEVVRSLDRANPKKIVLVAEDDPEIGDKIRDTLVLQEYRVKLAHTTEEARDMVGADDCDILVLDLRCPVIDALEIYLELQNLGQDLPTIVVSTYPDKQAGPIDVLRDQTVTGILIKPFDPARLIAALEKLKRKDTPAPVEEKRQDADPTEAHGGRILVIDDDRDVAEGMADVLSDLGHTVEIALTGNMALEIAERFDAQIALVDIKLGRTSGLELIASLEKLRPGIISVVITANAGKESVIASLRSGAFDFLNKPTHPRELFTVLERCFEKLNARQPWQDDVPFIPPVPGLSTEMGHELRDPLNAVMGFSEILGDEMLGPLGSEQYVHYAKGINEAGHHLTTVIDDLLEDSQTESSAMEPPGAGSETIGSEDGGPAQSGSGDTSEGPPSEHRFPDPDLAETTAEEPDVSDHGKSQVFESLAEKPVSRETTSVAPPHYGQQTSEPHPDGLDWPDPIASEQETDPSDLDRWEDVAAEAENPVTADSEVSEPVEYESRLAETFAEWPDIAALLAEDPKGSQADQVETGPAEPDGSEPGLAQTDRLDTQLPTPDSSGSSVDELWQEAAEPASQPSGGFEDLESDARDRTPTDPNWTGPVTSEADQTSPDWTEPYSPEVDQVEPNEPEWRAAEIHDPEPYAPWDEEEDWSAPFDVQPDSRDAPVLAPEPSEPVVNELDPDQPPTPEAITARPGMEGPGPGEPGLRGEGLNTEDQEDEPEEPVEIQNDGNRKILKFGPH
jgi:DNA-binding NtrC family response regulator